MTPEELAAAKQRATHHSYPRRVLLELDILGNVTFLRGKPGETISTHAQRAADAGKAWGKGLTKFLHLFQKNHGKLAEVGDLARAEDVEKTEEDAIHGPS